MKKLALLFGLLFAFPAFAADNAVIVTPGVGVTMKSKDIGAGVQAMQPVLSDASGNTLLTTAGADAVSNTLTGIPVYSRLLFYNGTTWDRWQGAVTLGAETTKVIGTVRVASGGIASGSVASGAIASGAVASGAYASGSIASGAMVDLGAQADSVCGTDTGTCSLIALVKKTNSNTSGAIPAGTAIIGKVTTDQTTHGTTDLVAADITKIGGTAVVSDPCQQVAHVFTRIDVAAAATTVLVAGTSSKKTYICSLGLMAAGTTNLGIVEGSGSTCGTSTLGLIGGNTSGKGLNLAAQAGVAFGVGNSAIQGTTVNANDICLINGSAIQVSGYIVTATP